jgi:hypothetical protein
MTYNDIINIAKRLDKDTQKKIDKDVEERLEILKEGDVGKEDLDKMEECLYMSLVLQEYLSGEYELLEEERELLLQDMEELYNEYSDLLSKAKLEEKLSKKKRMALYLMKLREQLFDRKERVKDVNDRLKDNQKNQEELKNLSDKKKMKELADENKKNLPNPDKKKWGLDNDSGRVKGKKDKLHEGGGGFSANDRQLLEETARKVRKSEQEKLSDKKTLDNNEGKNNTNELTNKDRMKLKEEYAKEGSSVENIYVNENPINKTLHKIEEKIGKTHSDSIKDGPQYKYMGGPSDSEIAKNLSRTKPGK